MYKTKEKILSLRLSREEYDYLKVAADQNDMKMSAFLRLLLHNYQNGTSTRNSK